MKIINEKGKLFGIINPVDLMVLIALLAIALGVCWKLFAPTIREAVAPTVEMTSTLRVRGANDFLLEELERNSPVGKKLVSGNEYTPATIESMEITDYIIQVTTASGEIVSSLDPTKKDIIFTVKSSSTKDTPTPKIGNQEVRAGRTFVLKTNDFEMNANVISVVTK